MVLTAGAMVGAYYIHLLFLIQNCYLGDGTGLGKGLAPAVGSYQGQFCGEPEGIPFNVILLGFESAAVAAVILFVVAWRSARSWPGKLAALIVPHIVMGFAWGALALPPDTCTDSQKANESANDCARVVR